MKKKKGTSLDEKCEILGRRIVEGGAFYNFKEVEAIARSENIPVPAVKEVLAILVEDKQVNCERIGSINFYWSLKSQIINSIQEVIAANQHELEYNSNDIRDKRQTVDLLRSQRLNSNIAAKRRTYTELQTKTAAIGIATLSAQFAVREEELKIALESSVEALDTVVAFFKRSLEDQGRRVSEMEIMTHLGFSATSQSELQRLGFL